MATKRIYIQPAMQVTQITLSSGVLLVSPGGSSNAPAIHPNIPTDEQW